MERASTQLSRIFTVKKGDNLILLILLLLLLLYRVTCALLEVLAVPFRALELSSGTRRNVSDGVFLSAPPNKSIPDFVDVERLDTRVEAEILAARKESLEHGVDALGILETFLF